MFADVGNPVSNYSEQFLQNPKYVKLEYDQILRFCQKHSNMARGVPNWSHHLKSKNIEENIKFYLIFNSINFNYFHNDSSSSNYQKCFTNNRLKGSGLLVYKLVQNWDLLKSWKSKKDLNFHLFTNGIFVDEVSIPLPDERIIALSKTFDFIFDIHRKYGSLENYFESMSNDALKLAMAINQITSWQDPFMKRSQLAVAQIYGKLQDTNSNPVDLATINKLTVFADYNLAKVVLAEKLAIPLNDLKTTLTEKHLIEPNSRMENELRSAIVVCGLIISQYLSKQLKRSVPCIEVDYLIWQIARGKKHSDIYRPRVITTHY